MSEEPPKEQLLFSQKQALEWDDYGYEVPLDRVELVIQNGHPVLRLVLNEAGFKRDVKSRGKENSLKNTYGSEEKNKEDALENFSNHYYEAFKRDGIKCFRESDSRINIFLPDDLDQALELVKKLNDYWYRGNIKHYDSYHGDEHPMVHDITIITRDEELPELMKKHFHKLKERLESPICDQLHIINDGNATMGVDKFASVRNSNPDAADASVYAVAFFPKSPEQLDLLHAAILKAAHYMPEYYDEFVRPKRSEKQERFYESPSYYLTGKEDGISLMELAKFIRHDDAFKQKLDDEVAARENYITKQAGFVLLREINLHDLKNLFKELETLNILEPTPQIAGELFHAVNSEYRSPIKAGRYDEEPDPMDGIFPDMHYDHHTLENYDFSENSLKLDESTSYAELVERFKDKISHTVRLQHFDEEAGRKSTQELFLSLYALAQMSVDGKVKLIGTEQKPGWSSVNTDNEATKLQLVKSRFEQLMFDICGYEKGADLDALLQSFSEQHHEQQMQAFFKRYDEHQQAFMEEWKAKGGVAGMLADWDKEERLEAANRSEEERTGKYAFSNKHRVKDSQSLIVRNTALPEIPYFDKRSAMSNPEVNFIPTTHTHTDYSSKKPGESLFSKIDLDTFHVGMEDKLKEYFTSLEKGKGEQRSIG